MDSWMRRHAEAEDDKNVEGNEEALKSNDHKTPSYSRLVATGSSTYNRQGYL